MGLTDRVVQAYLQRKGLPGIQGKNFLCQLLSMLRAQYINYQHCHWQTKGPNFYGQHLLFQRLYEGVVTETDELAEKIVGFYGSDAFNAIEQLSYMDTHLHSWSADNHVASGLASEKSIQEYILRTYEALKGTPNMTLGLDDWLMGLASAHETNLYLLQQVATSQTPSTVAKAAVEILGPAAAPSAEGHFFDNPEKREVREFAQSKAISNSVEVTENAIKDDRLNESPGKALMEADEAPPTPDEIAKEPGGDVVSTLNRMLVQTEEPVPSSVPKGHGQVPKHPAITREGSKLLSMWTFAPH